MEEYEDDSAPEDISLSKSRDEIVSSALKHLQESKRRLKEKRRRHDNLLKEQKRTKLEKLNKMKLSPGFLKKVMRTSGQVIPSADQSKLPNKMKQVARKHSKASRHKHFDNVDGDVDNDDDNDVNDGDVDGNEQKQQKMNQEELNPIVKDNLGSPGFHVLSASREISKPSPTPLAALEFRENNLYGKHVKRKSVSQIKSDILKMQLQPSHEFFVVKEKRPRSRKRGRKRLAETT